MSVLLGRPLRRPLGALLCAAMLGGCAGGAAPPDRAEAALAALPACDAAPAAAGADPVPGLVLPDEAVVTDVAPQGPLTQVSGYVAMTPVDVRAWFEQGLDVDGVRLLTAEDEVFESELLVASGDRRMYLRALALCDRGSALEATVAPAGQTDALPTPAGGAATPPPTAR